MKKFSKVLSLLLVFAMIVPGIAQAATVDAEEAAVVTRISGGNRYQTAANVSNQKFGKSKTVVLASGENWPDALAGTALAGVEGAPILLTAARRLHPDTKAELINLGAEKVIIVGGETVIPAAVEDELKAMGLTVDRKEGLKREDTAVAAAKGMTSKTAIIANGYESFADALSAGAYAGMNGMPILFVRQNSVPAGTLEGLKALGIENVIIAGGTSAVSAKVQSELAAYNPTRIHGEDREKTSLAFAEKFADNKEIIIANGYDYADALAGAALGAKIGAPVVLVNTNSVKTVVKGFIKENADKNHTVIGGTSAVSNNVMSDIEEIIAPVEEDELKVVSVSAINAKQLEVKFTQPIEKSSVISDAAGTIVANTVTVKRTVNDANDANKNVTTVTGSLSEDGKTLTLTASGATYFDGRYFLNISSLVSEAGEDLEEYAGTVQVSDKTAPTVSGVEYDPTTGKVTVTTSEPLTAAPTVLRVEGEPVTGGLSAVANTHNTKFEFNLPTGIKAGSTPSIYVTGGTDYAGNQLTAYSGNFVVVDDQSDLQVTSVSQVDSNVAKIVLNKSIKSNNTAIDGAITALIDGSTVAAANVTFAKDTNDTTGKTILATFDTAYTAPDYFYGSASSKVVTFVFSDAVIEDVFGKKLGTTTQTVTMTKDVTGPKAVSASVSDDGKHIYVQFDEVIQTLTLGSNNANVTLRKDGVAVDMTGGNAEVALQADKDGKNTIVKISPDKTAKLAAGTYTVRLEAETVADKHTNKSSVVTVNATVAPGETTPLTASIDNLSATNNQFKVEFSEKVSNSALDRNNYLLDGKVLPEGTDIYFTDSDRDTVAIVLPANSINVGAVGGSAETNNAELTVRNVSTSTGKVVTTTSATVTVEDNTPAVLEGATLVGNNILKLTFSEELTSFTSSDITDILDDIQVYAGATVFSHVDVDPTDGTGSAVDATATASVSGKDLIITVTPGESNWATVIGSSNVSVKTLGTGDKDIKDANGVVVKANVSVKISK